MCLLEYLLMLAPSMDSLQATWPYPFLFILGYIREGIKVEKKRKCGNLPVVLGGFTEAAPSALVSLLHLQSLREDVF